jgi:hypothetical protein
MGGPHFIANLAIIATFMKLGKDQLGGNNHSIALRRVNLTPALLKGVGELKGLS